MGWINNEEGGDSMGDCGRKRPGVIRLKRKDMQRRVDSQTVLEASEIICGARVPSGTENHCYRCDGNSLLHDALRLKGVD